jgi:hypothetical protein
MEDVTARAEVVNDLLLAQHRLRVDQRPEPGGFTSVPGRVALARSGRRFARN